MAKPLPKVSIGIASYNRPKYLINTIRNVIDISPSNVIEILVVDQTRWENINVDDQTTLLELSNKPLVNYLRREKPNLPAARNFALQLAKGEVIIWIDDDVILPVGFVESHLRNYIDPEVSAVAGLLYDRLWDVQPEEVKLENYNNPALTIAKPELTHYLADCKIVIGANHSVRTEVAKSVGYDEHFVGYGEDTDFAFRLRQGENGRIVADPRAWLLHLRVAEGGCRIEKKVIWSEYLKVGALFLHSFRQRHFHKLISSSIRVGPLRKNNLVRFWLQPYAWISYFYAIMWSLKRLRKVLVLGKIREI